MLYATAAAYDVNRIPADGVEQHLRGVAEHLFPAADGFDHQTLRLYLPGREQRLANSQVFRFVTVECQGPSPT